MLVWVTAHLSVCLSKLYSMKDPGVCAGEDCREGARVFSSHLLGPVIGCENSSSSLGDFSMLSAWQVTKEDCSHTLFLWAHWLKLWINKIKILFGNIASHFQVDLAPWAQSGQAVPAGWGWAWGGSYWLYISLGSRRLWGMKGKCYICPHFSFSYLWQTSLINYIHVSHLAWLVSEFSMQCSRQSPPIWWSWNEEWNLFANYVLVIDKIMLSSVLFDR